MKIKFKDGTEKEFESLRGANLEEINIMDFIYGILGGLGCGSGLAWIVWDVIFHTYSYVTIILTGLVIPVIALMVYVYAEMIEKEKKEVMQRGNP